MQKVCHPLLACFLLLQSRAIAAVLIMLLSLFLLDSPALLCYARACALEETQGRLLCGPGRPVLAPSPQKLRNPLFERAKNMLKKA